MTQNRLLCGSFSLALLLLSAFPVSAPSEHAIQEELLLYSRPDHGVVLQSGFSESQLVYNQGPHVAPRLSPDRNRILINSMEGGKPGVYIATPDGSRKERICDGSQAAWSPDGTRIVFQRDGRLVERTLSSGEERVVSPEGAPALAFPSYVPESGIPGADRRYGFVCTDKACGHVYLVAQNGQEPLELLSEGEIRSTPRCSPDGKTLAFQDGTHIYLMDFASREARQLTLDPGVQASPVWSKDGQSVCYARAPYPTAETWEICHVEVARPHIVNLIERRVHPGFDWRGSPPKSVRTTELPGTHLTVRQTLGAVTMENDWLTLRVSRDGARLTMKGKDAPDSPMTLRVMDAGNRVADEIMDISVVEDSQNAGAVRVSFVADGARILTATIRVPRTRPLVEVVAEDGTGCVGFTADMQLAIVPDRLSNDLVVDSKQIAAGATIRLPETPVVLGCLEDSDAMILLASLSDSPAFAVTNSDDGSSLTALTAAPGTASVVIAVLAAGSMWQPAVIEKDSARNTWSARWEKPFHAEWRMAVRGADTAYSRTWNVRDLGALGGGALPIDETFARAPETAVVYAWGRDVLSPANVLVPTDVVADIWGLEGYLTRLDTEGVRGYRTSNEGTPFRNLSLHGADWHPAFAHEEPTEEFGVLEVMGSVFPVDNDGVRSLLRHLGNDAVGLLQGLDDRIGEYEQLLRDIAAFSDAHKDEDRDGFLAAAGAQARELVESERTPQRTTIVQVEKALQKVHAIVGTRDRLTLAAFEQFCRLPGNEEWAAILDEFMGYLAAKEGRLWHNGTVRFELWYDDDFEAFARRCLRFVAERQRILSKYRTWTKRTCDRTALLILAHPEFKATGDKLRQTSHAVLRNRYYLEGDWRGETPLPTGALQ
jgi:Tol biopolymer transport system component